MIARMDDTNDKEEDTDHGRQGATALAEKQRIKNSTLCADPGPQYLQAVSA